ncbi:MAG: hypothetical protein ACOCVG_03345 [Verrucomicrobiota bacterium]
MKVFHFRLEPLLELRQRDEDRALNAYAITMRQRAEAERAEEMTRLALVQLDKEVIRTRNNHFDPRNQGPAIDASRLVEQQLIACEERCKEAREAEEAARQRYLEARTATQVMAKLKDKRQATHIYESNRREQEALEEATIIRSGRKMAEAPLTL